MTRLLLVVATTCLAGSTIFAQEFRRDVVYATRGKTELKMDIAFPEGDAEMRPVMMCLHGGGWFMGDKSMYHSRMKLMAKQGYVAATVQYRFSQAAPWPAQRDDVRDAFRWIVEHAQELKIDPERIGLVGESAGAHLALTLAMRPTEAANEVRPRAVINFFGPTDMRAVEEIKQGRRMVEALVGTKLEQAGQKLTDISPATFIDRTDPPVITFHGTKDNLVPFNQAEILQAALKKNQIPNELHPMEGVGHGFGPDMKKLTELMGSFGDRYLKGPDMPLVAFEDFEEGTDNWDFTEAAAWKTNKVGQRTFISLTKKKSDYQPKVRSPHNIALLKSDSVGDFVLEVDMRSTNKVYGHQDLCLFFGHQDPSHFYYVHLGREADPHANSIFLVNGEPRVSIAKERTKGTDWSRGWHRVRVKRTVATGAIEVFFDDMQKPVMTTVDKTFTSGRIGIGSFDDTGDFDAVRLWGNPAAATP